jgi:hypothetical protein
VNMGRLMKLLEETKALAQEYYELTGKPLGVTGEVAEYEAARHLGLELAPPRMAGYDALRTTAGGEERVQVKGRCIPTGAKPGQRLGKIDLTKPWDVVVLVLLDVTMNPTAMYEAKRPEITAALTAPGSRARNERGALSVSKFKSIGQQVWP